MAWIFKLYDGTNTIDLTSATDFQLIETNPLTSDYVSPIAEPTGDGSIPAYVTEVISVRVNNSSDDNLATAMQKLHTLQREVGEYWADSTRAPAVWLHQQLPDETGERRALVRAIKFEPAQNWFRTAPALTEGLYGQLIVVRHPHWERTATVAMNAASPSAAASVLYNYTNVADVVGDTGARVGRLQFRITAVPLDRFWIGVRSADYGTPANFANIWECESGANGTDATDTADGNASGSSKVRVTPSGLTWDDTWQRAFYVTVNDITANESDQYGDHLWLLRAAVTSGTWEVKVIFGPFTLPADVAGYESEIIEISSTSWNYYDMGVAGIPARDLQVFPTSLLADSYDQHFAVHVYAQRTSGSGSLDLDCLCPVPVSEGFCYVEGAAMTSLNSRLDIASSPQDVTKSICHTGSSIYSSPATSPSNFVLPPGDGRLVIVYARAGSSTLSDPININYGDIGRFYPRWASLRGSE